MLVIIVCHESAALLSLKRGIKDADVLDAEIKCFHEPEDALRFARENPVDVAFVDMETRLIHGFVLSKKLKEINPSVNLILTASTGEYAAQTWQLFPSDYLVRPFDRGRIGHAMENLRYTVR